MPRTICNSEGRRLDTSPSNTSFLLFIDKNEKSINYWRDFLVEQFLEEYREFAFIKCLAGVQCTQYDGSTSSQKPAGHFIDEPAALGGAGSNLESKLQGVAGQQMSPDEENSVVKEL